MIDIHCHILPGIDDGSKDLDTSIQMLNTAVETGTKKCIATPHYYWGQFENNYISVTNHVKKLNSEAALRNIPIEIFPGQEVFVDKHTLDLCKRGIIRGLNHTKYILIEFPIDVLPSDAFDLIYELKILGAKPIIAHPERYVYIINKTSTINRFIEEECLFQINSSSIMGLFGPEVKKTALTLIENGICQFIASDAHSTGRRNADMTKALSIIKKEYSNIFESIIKNGQNVLDDRDINIDMKAIQEKKGIFSRIFSR